MGALALAGTAMVMVAPVASAQADNAREFDIPSQDLGAALRAIVQQSGTQVIAPTELVAGHQAPALKGQIPSRGCGLAVASRQPAARGVRRQHAGRSARRYQPGGKRTC
ncbi:hypothetical protein [Sphingomonas leidyi]|uniref:hypothetical protein n=1 Tax=Sphingomonas leidyi TaxID=68569 RepID=UPI0036D3407C